MNKKTHLELLLNLNMSAYCEFKRNPWNFLTRKLKLTIKEKELEEQIADMFKFNSNSK